MVRVKVTVEMLYLKDPTADILHSETCFTPLPHCLVTSVNVKSSENFATISCVQKDVLARYYG